MTNAALYISTLQNEDGGFGYQQGLSSNAYLTADIANILVDTIVDKNITFIGLGDENSSEQYQQIVQLIPDNAFFYEYSDDTALTTIKNNIIDTEEAKRILDSDAVVATNLTITGEMPDGSSFVQY